MTKIPDPLGFFGDPALRRWIDPFPGERVAGHVDGGHTGHKFSLSEGLFQPGIGQPEHIHHNLDEVLYVLEGTIDFLLEGRRFRTGPGGFAFIARGNRHAFRNLTDAPARMLGIFSPSNMDGFFEAMDGQPMSAFPEIAGRFGIEIVGDLIEPLG